MDVEYLSFIALYLNLAEAKLRTSAYHINTIFLLLNSF